MIFDIDSVKSLSSEELQRICKQRDEDGRSILHVAASKGDGAICTNIINSGGERLIDAADDEGWTPLHSSVSAGHQRVVEVLLAHGADVNICNSGGRNALHYAASKGRTQMLKLLLEKGANANAGDNTGSTALHRACSAGKLEAVKLLVEVAKTNLEARDKSKATPLFVAATCGEQPIALYLISKGADVEAENIDTETPLSAAATHPGLRDKMVALAKGEMEIDE